jgi:hypothetical protein
VRVVEFVGPPGAGKTRILENAMEYLPPGVGYLRQAATHRWLRTKGPNRPLRALLTLLPLDPGIKVANRVLGRAHITRAALERFRTQHTAYLDTALALVDARRSTLPEAELFRTWIPTMCARYQLAIEALGDDAVLMFEEGFGTRGVGLFAHGWDDGQKRDAISYVKAMPLPAVVVLVDTDVETCRRRLEERGWTKRTRAMSDADKIVFLEGARAASRLIADRLGGRGAEVVRTHSEDDDDENASAAEVITALGNVRKDRKTR